MADIGTGYIIELEIESLNGHGMADLDFTVELPTNIYLAGATTYDASCQVIKQGILE